MLIDLLKESGALLEGHFLLSSGKHSDKYVQCAKLLQYPDKAEKAISAIIEKLNDVDFDIIVGPAMGGIIVGYELGRQTGKPSIFTERVDGKMTLRRGFKIESGQKVLIAEDVVTTGKSSFETIEVIESLGGKVVGIASIVDRTSEEISVPLYSAVKIEVDVYDEENCPLCKEGIPYVKPGSRKMKK